MARIQLKNVKKIYAGGVEAIKGISMDIADGELIVLVGPSGCGKSTLLRMVAGLESITEGEVLIKDRVVNQLEPAERDIAMVFQNYALYPHMTVRQNLAYGLKNRGTPQDEIDRRIAEAAKSLEIEPFLERKPRQLSGGQRQRVAMGRAIVRKPEAFLFDEPLSNLDAKLRVQMRVEIRRLQRALATTSIYVTHDQMEAMTLADRLVVMNAGRVEQIGSPIELYEKPATTFVATFIGSPSMNLLPVGPAIDGGHGWTLAEGLSLPSHIKSFGIRPEDLEISTDGPSKGFSADVVVDAVELIGAESYIHSSLPNGQILVFRYNGRASFDIGQRLTVTAAPQNFHLFDTEGNRI